MLHFCSHLVFPCNNPMMQCLYKWLATCTSTAARGSSNRYTNLSLHGRKDVVLLIACYFIIVATWYTARASDILAFCPPLRVTPFSPTSVMSPAGRICRSCINRHSNTTYSIPIRTRTNTQKRNFSSALLKVEQAYPPLVPCRRWYGVLQQRYGYSEPSIS